jgi:adenine-specific DNA-methyltransferase
MSGKAIENATLANTLDQTEKRRRITIEELDREERSALGQFMTPMDISCFMANMFNDIPGDIRLLDAGAGTGSLTAAFVQECCSRRKNPRSIRCTAFELDDVRILQRTVNPSPRILTSPSHQTFVTRILSKQLLPLSIMIYLMIAH